MQKLPYAKVLSAENLFLNGEVHEYLVAKCAL